MPNLIGSLKQDGTITGYLSNATLRGVPVELRMDGTMLQWKYTDESTWKNLIDLQSVDYEKLINLPQIEGVELLGNKTLADFGLTALSTAEIEAVLT